MITQIFGKNENGGNSAAQVLSTGRLVIDNYLQDQTSRIVDRFLTRQLGTATLASPLAFEDRTIDLVSGHGFVVGNMIELESTDGNSYQSRVTVVSGDTITVAEPINTTYDTDTTVRRVTQSANVDGSTTPVVFSACPPDGVHWDVNILSINILDGTEMDDGKFGGIPALTNGVVFRTVNHDNNNIFNALDNGCFLRHCDVWEYTDKAPAGVYGFNAQRHFNGQTGDGVSRRLDGELCGEIQAVVADDLTGLTRFWIIVRGHVVE